MSRVASPPAVTVAASRPYAAKPPANDDAAFDRALTEVTEVTERKPVETKPRYCHASDKDTASATPEKPFAEIAAQPTASAAPADIPAPSAVPMPMPLIAEAMAELGAPTQPAEAAQAVAVAVGGKGEVAATPAAYALAAEPAGEAIEAVAAKALPHHLNHHAPQTDAPAAQAASLAFEVTAPAGPMIPAASTTATPTTAASGLPAQPGGVPIDALPVTIAAEAQAGARTFTIRLDPAELGEVQIRLHIGEDGVPRAHLIVERPSTLQHLMQDAPKLEQALAATTGGATDAGVTFSLRDEHPRHGTGASAGQQVTPDDSDADTGAAKIPSAWHAARNIHHTTSRLDLML